MIDKTIHYCWFGNKSYPDIVKKCIASWNKYCPDYKFVLWNEKNYDVRKNKYVREAYENKKYAFVSDFVRLDIIFNYGGIYLDTDVELVRSLDDLLQYHAFFAADGSGINTGLGFGSEKGNLVIKSMMDMYLDKNFVTKNGFDLTPCSEINTKIFLANGYKIDSKKIEEILGISILPPEYFSPIVGATSKLIVTENTFGIHWGARLWESGLTRFKAYLRMKLGDKMVTKIKSIYKREL